MYLPLYDAELGRSERVDSQALLPWPDSMVSRQTGQQESDRGGFRTVDFGLRNHYFFPTRERFGMLSISDVFPLCGEIPAHATIARGAEVHTIKSPTFHFPTSISSHPRTRYYKPPPPCLSFPVATRFRPPDRIHSTSCSSDHPCRWENTLALLVLFGECVNV